MIAFERGRTNVYADLGFPDAEERLRKAELAPRAIALKFSCLAPQEVGQIVGTPTGFKSFVFDP